MPADLRKKLPEAVPFDAAKHGRDAHGRFAAAKPTPAQAEAGNYRKGHVKIAGMDISIENQAGSIRTKTNKIGQTWSVRMPAHYGYIRGTKGADGDHVDTYVGPGAHKADQMPVHVVDQIHPHNGKFDEHKVLMGFPSKVDALSAYDAGFSDGSGPQRRGAVHTMTMDGFKGWLKRGDTTRAIDPSLRPHVGPPSFSTKPLAEPGMPRRSATKGEAWQRNGRLYAPASDEIPIGYTGDRRKEHEVGTMLHHSFVPQIPKSMPVQHWMGLMRRLGDVAIKGRTATVDNAMTRGVRVPTHKMSGPRHTQWLPPEGTSRASMNRAYVHATKLAMHDFGVADYDFHMDDHLKGEMHPLTPFIRHARRKLRNDMYVAEPGGWRQFRAEFGRPFPNAKYDRVTGAERLRVRPNEELVKRLAKLAGLAALRAPSTALGLPTGMPQRPPKQGVLPAQQGVSRFARYRMLLARDEMQGHHDLTPLTPAQKLQRLHAGIAERRKVQSGAPKLMEGQAGSIAGQDLKRPTSPNAPAPTPTAPRAPGLATGARVLR